MPLLNVALSDSSDDNRNSRIAAMLTRLTEQHLGKDPSLTAVTIRPVTDAMWFIGGQALTADKTASFSLHITVTQGTNTKPQMADYIKAVFTAMTEQIGSLREESYIVIQEAPAAAWGYGGLTQEQRFITSRTLSA